MGPVTLKYLVTYENVTSEGEIEDIENRLQATSPNTLDLLDTEPADDVPR